MKLDELAKPDAAAVERGLPNLAKHLESIGWFKESPLVALNRFGADTADEIKVVRDYCDAQGVPFAVSDHFARGGDGALELAEVLRSRACVCNKPFTPMYGWDEPVKDKIFKVASKIYGAEAVDYTPESKWGMGPIPHSGKLYLRTRAGKSREFILLGRQNGEAVRAAILSGGRA